LRARPRENDVWIFAYGSLIWNPLVNFAEIRLATLHGLHRSFCLRTIAGRGTAKTPGRMLSLAPGERQSALRSGWQMKQLLMGYASSGFAKC
jgi:cation transport protein ChaC